MTWAALIPVIIQYGLPFAEKLWSQWTNNAGATPTQGDWDELKALASNNARTQMLAALSRAGIDPNSPTGQQFIALVPTT